MIPFIKTHALGNDFILVEGEATTLAADPADLARRICHRNFGVGADGLIFFVPREGLFDLRIFNRDGSETECSGNGLRCAAAYLTEAGRSSAGEVRLRTMSGLYTLRRVGARYEADMGVPKLRPEEIPFLPYRPMDRVVDEPLGVDGERVHITACATGNPHCSLFIDAFDEQFFMKMGPVLEHHPAFPNRTNVEFVRVINDREIEVAFWERGVGPTYASGTGSCGAVVACVLNGKTGRAVTVHTRAGDLLVEWRDGEGGRLRLTSTANVVAEGRYLEA